MQRHALLLLTLLASLLLVTAPADGSVFRVGSDGNCTHTRLADAIRAAADNGTGMDLIMVAKNHTDTDIHVSIHDHSVKIAGGFAQCNSIVPSGQTTLDGAGGVEQRVIIISSSSTPREVILQDLNIQGGEDGGVLIFGKTRLDLKGVTIRNNDAAEGGGLYIAGGLEFTKAPSVTIDKSDILSNHATVGGGIYCTRLAFLELQRGSISLNSATGDGGGIWFDGCSVTLSAQGVLQGVFLNDSGDQGGGVYGADGTLRIRGGTVNSNSALQGGGIAVEAHASIDFGEGARVSKNSAFEGGGVYSNGSRPLLIQGTTFDGNTAHNGAGIYLVGGSSKLHLWRSTLVGNRATGEGGGVYSESPVEIWNSTFSDNEADRGAGAHLEDYTRTSGVMFTSFVDHQASTGIDLYLAGGGVWLENSLFTGGCVSSSGGDIMSSGGNVDVIGRTCHPNAAHAPNRGALLLQPLASNGGPTQTHRISPGSFAESRYRSEPGDIDQRGVGRDAFADAGAFEQDAFFGDGFESGDLSRWSGSVGDS